MIDVEVYATQARAWLDANAGPKRSGNRSFEWGVGSDSVSVFHVLSFGDELALVRRGREWQRCKFDAGYGAITWPVEYGGAGLTGAHARAFQREQAAFETPDGHEVLGVTLTLIAPVMRAHGTEAQKHRFIGALLRNDVIGCQLFSEPGAGSDLASLGTKAVRDGDEWVLDGQKVWSSGAQFAEWGLAITRHDPSMPKHRGMTAFMVPFDAPGVEIRPIRQMSGGSSFNEVFLSGVRLPDELRIGDVGDGWRVALTTLGFERGGDGDGGGGGQRVGGSWDQVLGLARRLARTADPTTRQELAGLFTHLRLMQLNGGRTASNAKAGQTPGPEGSIGRLYWTQSLTRIADVVSNLLGAALTADSGEWGTFAWTEHVTGAPGYRIAGGSQEIQRNIIGERVLGLPLEPRVDRDVPWSQIPK